MKDGKRCFYNQVEKEAGREDRIRSGLMKVPKAGLLQPIHVPGTEVSGLGVVWMFLAGESLIKH